MAAGFPTPTVCVFPLARGRVVDAGPVAVGVARLPTDPVGAFKLTLTNLAIGSALQVETTSGLTLLNTVALASEMLINLDAYPVGSPNNSLRIKVRKGSSAPYYVPWETLTTAAPGTQTIFVSQIPDE